MSLGRGVGSHRAKVDFEHTSQSGGFLFHYNSSQASIQCCLISSRLTQANSETCQASDLWEELISAEYNNTAILIIS